MNLGALVMYGGHRWRVYKLDRHVRTVTLIRWGGAQEEIADDDPALSVVADPSEWPVVTARVRPNAGPLVKLCLTRGTRLRQLEPLVDWVPSDMSRPGGSIFVSPALQLKMGEILLAEYKSGSASRIVITKRFGSMAERKLSQVVPEKSGLLDFLDGEDLVK